MTNAEFRAALEEIRPQLERGDIKAANLLCEERYGRSYPDPAILSRFLSGKLNSTFRGELLKCLQTVVKEREATLEPA